MTDPQHMHEDEEKFAPVPMRVLDEARSALAGSLAVLGDAANLTLALNGLNDAARKVDPEDKGWIPDNAIKVFTDKIESQKAEIDHPSGEYGDVFITLKDEDETVIDMLERIAGSRVSSPEQAVRIVMPMADLQDILTRLDSPSAVDETDPVAVAKSPPVSEAGLRAMLSVAMNQFRFYADQHLAKGTDEANEKARVNLDLASQIDLALRCGYMPVEIKKGEVSADALGTDALTWAKAFVATFGGCIVSHENGSTVINNRRVDLSDLIGWFANAIMLGYDQGRADHGNDVETDPPIDRKTIAQMREESAVAMQSALDEYCPEEFGVLLDAYEKLAFPDAEA